MQRIEMPFEAALIIERLNHAGYKAYVVGGCVRDSLLSIEPHDWDICTSANPEEVMECFKEEKIIPTGLKHGTMTLVRDQRCFEITTFRVESEYSDNRHPDEVIFVDDLVKDLARRDFTINAMAYNDQEGIIDPFGGVRALEEGQIRCVGDPNERFQEDALRILRAIRFAATYGFQIEERTERAIHDNVHLLNNIAAERVNIELIKTLVGVRERVLDILLKFSDIICTIIPEMHPCVGFNQNNKYHLYTVYDHIAHAVANYQGGDPVVVMTLLLHDIGKPLCYTENETGGHFHGHGVVSRDIAEQILERLRFDNKSKHDILELVLFHDSVIEPTEKTVRRWLNKIGEVQFARLLDVRSCDILAHSEIGRQARLERNAMLRRILRETIEKRECFSLKDLQINGRDIMALGVPEGKAVGEILKWLLDVVMSGELQNEREFLLAATEQHLKS